MSENAQRRTATGGRGAYAKGVAKREEILTRALQVIAREGYRGASVKEIAEAVGLSQAGLVHYFDSKEHLFTEILRKRDDVDAGGLDVRDGVDYDAFTRGYLGIIRHNSEVPGLVQLFSRLAVDAADPEHPAHDYFSRRGQQLRSTLGAAVRAEQDAGRISDRVDADTVARMFQALADGMQLQWMLEPEVDMTGAVSALFELLGPGSSPHGAHRSAATDA